MPPGQRLQGYQRPHLRFSIWPWRPRRPFALEDLEHPVTAYLNGLAPSSRRPQLSALDWIARRTTHIYTAETMPWQRLRHAHVLRIRGLLEEHYHPATANRILSALRGVLRECWQVQLMSIEDYQAATGIPAVRGESEMRGRNLSAGELSSLFAACTRPTNQGQRHDSTTRRRRDAAFLALAYSCGLRRSEAVAIDLVDLDLASGELRVRRDKGRKPRHVTLPPSALPAVHDWCRFGDRSLVPFLSRAQVRAPPAGGRSSGPAQPGRRLADLSGARPPGPDPDARPHDLRRTWIGDLLDLGVDLATVQKMAGHASASTTGRYDRRDQGVQRKATGQLHVPYVAPDD